MKSVEVFPNYANIRGVSGPSPQIEETLPMGPLAKGADADSIDGSITAI